MATAGLPLWSTTAANNGTSDPAVNWAEGMAPSAVNDSARNEMASVAGWRNALNGITTGGSSTAYTITTPFTFASLAAMDGMTFTIIPHTTSGASPTLAVDSLTAKSINEQSGTAVATGALISGTPYRVYYSNSNNEFILIGRSNVYNTLNTKGVLTQSSTSHGVIATGTTGQRPAATVGGWRFNTTTSLPEYSDGSNWLSLLATLAGAQLPYGGVFNGTITESHNANAVTFSLKTLAGNDPSAGDPVLLTFRNSTLATGNYSYLTVTSALSLTVSSGSTLGTSNSTAFKLWHVLFNDGGTIRWGVINCLSGTNVYPLGQVPIVSSTAEGGLGGADSAQVFYTGSAVTSKAYVVLGYTSYESGLGTAGNWASSPTRIQLYGAGVPLPGEIIQRAYSATGASTTGSTVLPIDNTIPQNTEGDQYMSLAITPTSAANMLEIETQAMFGNSGAADNASALFQDSNANALIATCCDIAIGNHISTIRIYHQMIAGTASSTTFKNRIGSTAGTVTFNGGGGTQVFNGVANSFMKINEIMS